MRPADKAIRVVIPCKEADATIERCLCALVQTCGSDIQVVVVDDGGNSVLDIMERRFPFSRIASVGETGAGASRNLGARGFTGEVLVFVDADVQVTSPDTIATLIAPITGGKADATMGCYASSRRNNLFETYKHAYLAYTYGNKTGELKNTFWTGLCAVKREWFASLGGFKECYAGAGPEDIEFGVTLTRNGGRIRAVPEAQGTHLASLSFTGLIANDLRKGSEDVYIHWSRKIPLTNNRHVETADILAVASGTLLMFCMPLSFLIGSVPMILFAALYLIFRRKLLLKAFWRMGNLFFVGAILLTFILDLVRACAIVIGTCLWGIDRATGGKRRPFLRPSTL